MVKLNVPSNLIVSRHFNAKISICEAKDASKKLIEIDGVFWVDGKTQNWDQIPQKTW